MAVGGFVADCGGGLSALPLVGVGVRVAVGAFGADCCRGRLALLTFWLTLKNPNVLMAAAEC